MKANVQLRNQMILGRKKGKPFDDRELGGPHSSPVASITRGTMVQYRPEKRHTKVVIWSI